MNTKPCSNPFKRISRALIHCPLFFVPMQCLYIFVSLILPLLTKQWNFSNFLLVYFFGALSLFTYLTHRLIKNKRNSSDIYKCKWFGVYMQKSLAHPEIDSTLFGIIIFIYLICCLWRNIIIWSISGFVSIFAIVLLQWYMFKGMENSPTS